MCASLYHVFQRLAKFARHIEGAMKRSLQWTRHLNQAVGPCDVDIPIFLKDSEHDSARAELLGHEHILLHGLKLLGGVAEIAATRANHDINVEGELGTDGGDQTSAGGNATFKKIDAQLHTM